MEMEAMNYVCSGLIWVFHIVISLLAVAGLGELVFREQDRMPIWVAWILFAALVLTLHYVR